MVCGWRGWGHGVEPGFHSKQARRLWRIFTRGYVRTVGYGSRSGVGVRGNQYCRYAYCRGEAVGSASEQDACSSGSISRWRPVCPLIPITHPQGSPPAFPVPYRLAHAPKQPHITWSFTLVSSVPSPACGFFIARTPCRSWPHSIPTLVWLLELDLHEVSLVLHPLCRQDLTFNLKEPFPTCAWPGMHQARVLRGRVLLVPCGLCVVADLCSATSLWSG